MDHHDDSVDLQSGGSPLLSESPVLPSESSSYASNPNDDFSISELSLSSPSKPFSLLAKPPTPPTPTPTRQNETEDDGEGFDDDKDVSQAPRKSARTREEELQSDLFVLRKINTAFMEFNDALDNVGSANERISEQLEQTEELLNKYVNILAKSEDFAQLLFDERWEGGDVDIEILERERLEALERRRKEEEELALAAQREKERLEREERERQEKLERERVEKERKEHAGARGSGVRGVRGTRASMRGIRGASGTARGGSGNAAPSATTRGRPVSRIARGAAPRS
ncbi:hypothetical protein VKT23_009358 [Stygiomarasmius scandens]|uniref:DASH complex subunit DUO1 n=1 Tax=Marasmiellus scandens TaxID=2682957 RepID=A0ABR1JG38_9AGAR